MCIYYTINLKICEYCFCLTICSELVIFDVHMEMYYTSNYIYTWCIHLYTYTAV